MARTHTPVGESTMLFIGGSSTSARCACGCNVFTRLDDLPSGEHLYQCNGCADQYAARDSDA